MIHMHLRGYRRCQIQVLPLQLYPNPVRLMITTFTQWHQHIPAGMRFKPSPFFRVDQAVSGIVECPGKHSAPSISLIPFHDFLESTSSTDRKQQTLTFTLNSEQLMKINSTTYVPVSALDASSLTHSPSAKFQLRLYCTSNTFYSSGFRPSAAPCPIEFPPTCEVRVNGVQLTANLKGLKKKPGTAPPADLGRTVRTTGQNRVEMVYVNSQQPVQPKVGRSVIYTRFALVSLAEILSHCHACGSHDCRTARGQAQEGQVSRS